MTKETKRLYITLMEWDLNGEKGSFCDNVTNDDKTKALEFAKFFLENKLKFRMNLDDSNFSIRELTLNGINAYPGFILENDKMDKEYQFYSVRIIDVPSVI